MIASPALPPSAGDRERRLQGLSTGEAAQRLAAGGPNELPSRGGRSIAQIVLETLREPMFLLLAGAAGLYLVLGSLGEGLFLTFGAAASIGLVIVQEARSERALAALRDLAQPLARVLRDGEPRQIPARELVPDDVLLVGEGERLPADGVLIGGDVLAVDESALTGESASVAKHPAVEVPQTAPPPGGEGGPFVFAGTLVVGGQGVVLVTRTGAESAIGRIGRSLAEIVDEPTPLQRTASRLVTILGLVALLFCGVVAAAYGMVRHDWFGGVLAGITVAISLVPEEFPMVLAVFMALGAWRLARHQVLVRRSAVIETLGAATVLCVDKTGTLTENRMRVARVWAGGEDRHIDGEGASEGATGELLRIAALASAVQPVDPMDRAVHAAVGGLALAPRAVGYPERTWPLRPALLAVVQVWPLADDSRLAAAKGAPEAIFRLCRLPEAEIVRLHQVIDSFAQEGLRVLGVAHVHTDAWTADEPSEEKFDFVGLIGFLDPLRGDVRAALAETKAAGIKVVMITGDHPATARAIARSAGIDTSAGVIEGAELDRVSVEDLGRRLRDVRVFARISPDQKLKIVQALKAEGEVVAMTGDGINDAPALEAAHIGLAMGRKGTDVAREAADLILLDDSFASIVGGVRLGRRIFANLRRALTYITAIHIPIAGLALLPVLLGLPPMLFPMHVVLLELVIDPTCALVFEVEPSDASAMKRRPRPRDEPLFGPAQIGFALLQGVSLLGGALGVYLWGLAHQTETQARGAAFLTLTVGNLVLALADSASSGRLFGRHSRIFWSIAGAVAVGLAGILLLPGPGKVFSVSAPSWPALAVALAVAVIAGGWSVVLRASAMDRRPPATEAARPRRF